MAPSLTNVPTEIMGLIVSSLQDSPSDDYIPQLAHLALTCRTIYCKIGSLLEADIKFHQAQARASSEYSIFGKSTRVLRKSSLFWYIEKSNDIKQITACIRAWKSRFPESILRGVVPYPEKRSPGYAAIRRRRLDILQILIREGFPVAGGESTSSWLYCKNLLMAAVEEGSDAIATWLIDQGATFNRHEVEAAVWYNRPQILSALLRKGTETTGGLSVVLGERGLETALLTTCTHSRRLFDGPVIDGKREIIDILVEAGASISNATAPHHYYPLDNATMYLCFGNALCIFEHQIRQGLIPGVDLWRVAGKAAQHEEGLKLIKAIHPKFTHLIYESDRDRMLPMEVVFKKARQRLIDIAARMLSRPSRLLRYLRDH